MAKGKVKKIGKKHQNIAKLKSTHVGIETGGEQEESDENELEPEDLDYFQDTGRSFRFLQDVVEGAPGSGKERKRKRLDGEKKEEGEAEFEKRPRIPQADQDNNEKILLPIKNKQGIIQRKEKWQERETGVDTTISDEKEPAANTELTEPDSPAVPDRLSMVELFKQRQQKLDKRKMRIAELSNNIVENPEENVSGLKELCMLCTEKDPDVRITTKKLAMVSLLAVFKDIVPGYPIRLASEKEQGVKLSKEVKKIRDFEEVLLKNYQQYLQILEETVQVWMKSQKQEIANGSLQKIVATESVAIVAVQCMCNLLTSLPHFNFHTNLITVLVPLMSAKCLGVQVSKQCFEAFSTLFKQDSVGSVSLEAVKIISKFVKSKGFRVQPRVLETFLSLRISQIDIRSLVDQEEKKDSLQLKIEKSKNKMEKKLKGKMSKKEKKRKKEMKNLERELQETEAVESQQKRAKLQTEILKLVFVTYFHVLKTAGHSPLLSPILEGLAKFAHLINVDFFVDLMASLQALLESQELSLRETLNCILTAFKILSGQGEALNVDPRGFYSTLYLSLLQMHVGGSSEDVPVILQCLDVMLNKRRKQVPIQRIAGFVKRLCSVSLQSQPNGTLAFLAYVKSFLQSHTRVQTLLDSDSVGTGLFRPDIEDPELSNAESTTAWELSVLARRHYHPTVRTVAQHIAEGAPSKGQSTTLMRMLPEALFKEYSASEMKLNPDLTETEQNRKQVNFKKLKCLDVGEWKNPSFAEAVRTAVHFSELSNAEVKFSLSKNDDR